MWSNEDEGGEDTNASDASLSKALLSDSGGEITPNKADSSNCFMMGAVLDNVEHLGGSDDMVESDYQEREFARLFEKNGMIWQKKKYVWMFPPWLEKKFQRFDDTIISRFQQFKGKFWYYFSLSVTALVAIELAMAAPFVLFILGYDGLATEFTYLGLITALVSQVPKRFLWRFRPYMVNRANLVKKDLTSSFPSRAVTCATVYSYAVIWAYVYKTMPHEDSPVPFKWWMPLLFFTTIFLASFARINLGVHYPSDCAAGFVQGLLMCVFGTLFWQADTLGCASCRHEKCYSTSDDKIIGLHTEGHFNYYMIFVILAICVLIPVVSVMKPIDFWTKSDRTYGMLFPGITFQLLFLCPQSGRHTGSLAPPTHHFTWYNIVIATTVVGAGTLFSMKVKGHPFIVYFVLYSVFLSALVLCRLVIS